MEIGDLEKLYNEANQVDSQIFSEQKSNLLLVSGDHYSKGKRKEINQRIRDNRSLTEEQRLRITKNHIQKITDTYINNILTHAPGVTVVPDLDNELTDQKAAELHLAIWQDAKQRHKIKSKVRDWCKDFVEIGEVAVKITWDASKGDLLGFEQPVLEEGQEPDPEMKPTPIFSGDFVFEKVYGFNLLRAPEAKSMDESRYIIIRKMVNAKDLKKRYENDETKAKFVQKSEDETFVVFDGSTNDYTVSKTDILVKEYYFKPCVEYPNGYFYITTKEGVLEEGEIPFGIFPIIYQQFDSVQTSARGRSKIKQLRPWQIEINRCSSQVATHQITLGDDKLVTNTAGKVEHGGTLPGIRVVKVPGGGNLTVLPGRTGDQFLPYLQSQISELYAVANVDEIGQDKQDNSTEPMVMLFKSIKQKKAFSMYIEKFEEFLIEVTETYLKLAKEYLPDERVIPAIGRREIVNIAEYRSSENLGYRIKCEAQSEDAESKMGKQMVLNHALQYVGGQLSSDDIGKILKNMPFANVDGVFDDLTLDYENARNDMLALDRGEQAPVNPYDNHDYLIKKLSNRMRQADFRYLDPMIQQLYAQKLTEHEQFKAAALQEIQMAESGFIPTGGYLVKADLYVTTADGKNKRATVPYESLQWLIQKLEQQGLAQEELEKMQMGAQADIANQLINNGGQASPPQQGDM